jgi:hypothetical protein
LKLTRFARYNIIGNNARIFAQSFYYRINMNSHFLEWFSTKYYNKNLQLLPDHCIWHKGYLTFSSFTTLIIVPNWTNVVWIYLCMCTWFCKSFFTKMLFWCITNLKQPKEYTGLKEVSTKDSFCKFLVNIFCLFSYVFRQDKYLVILLQLSASLLKHHPKLFMYMIFYKMMWHEFFIQFLIWTKPCSSEIAIVITSRSVVGMIQT